MGNAKYLSFKVVSSSFECTFYGFTSLWCNDEYIHSIFGNLRLMFPLRLPRASPNRHLVQRNRVPNHIYFSALSSCWRLCHFDCRSLAARRLHSSFHSNSKLVSLLHCVHFAFWSRASSPVTLYVEGKMEKNGRWFIRISDRFVAQKFISQMQVVCGWTWNRWECNLDQFRCRRWYRKITLRNKWYIWLFGVYTLCLFLKRDFLFDFWYISVECRRRGRRTYLAAWYGTTES